MSESWLHAVLRWNPPRYPPIGLHLLAAPVPVPGRYLFVGESLNERGQGCQVRSSYSTDGGGRKDARVWRGAFGAVRRLTWPDIYVVFINDNFYYFNILSIWITDYCDFEFEIYGLLQLVFDPHCPDNTSTFVEEKKIFIFKQPSSKIKQFSSSLNSLSCLKRFVGSVASKKKTHYYVLKVWKLRKCSLQVMSCRFMFFFLPYYCHQLFTL